MNSTIEILFMHFKRTAGDTLNSIIVIQKRWKCTSQLKNIVASSYRVYFYRNIEQSFACSCMLHIYEEHPIRNGKLKIKCTSQRNMSIFLMVGWYLCVFGPFVFSCFVLFDKYSAQTKKMHFDESYNLFYIDFFIVLLNCDEYTENTLQIHSKYAAKYAS